MTINRFSDIWSLDDNDHDYLQRATVSTQVICDKDAFGAPRLRLTTIDRVTPKRVIVDNTVYDRQRGREVGGTHYHIGYIYPPTPERLAATKIVAEEYQEMVKRNKLIHHIGNTRWGNVPTTTLESIVTLLKGESIA